MKTCNSFSELQIGSVYSGSIQMIALSKSGSVHHSLDGALYLGSVNEFMGNTYRFLFDNKIIQVPDMSFIIYDINLFELKDIE